MLYKVIAAEITEALAEAMLDVAKEEVAGALAKQAQDKMRLQDKTYEEWKDLIFTIAFTGNFPKDDRVTVLANQVNAAHQRIDALEKQFESLSKALDKKVNYLRSEIFKKAEQSLYSAIANEDNLFKHTLLRINKSFSASGSNLEHDQAKGMASHFAGHILEEAANYKESINRIFTTLMPSKNFDSANLFDAWKSAAIFHSEFLTLGESGKRFNIYKEMERKFASILLLQLRYMQVLLDAYRMNQASPLPVRTDNPQQFLNWFYGTYFEPEVTGFVATVEQWIVNVFPYPQSPVGQVEIPEDIRQILAQVNYFAEKTLRPIKEYVTIFNWNNSLAKQTTDLQEYLQKTIAIDPLKPLQKRNDQTLETTGDSAGGIQRTVALHRVASAPTADDDGIVSLTVDGKLCQTYRYQAGEVTVIAQPEALQGRILIPGDRWRNYQNQSKLLVRLVDTSSSGQQFEAIGRLEFQNVNFLRHEQNGALRGLGLLVGGRWRHYPELLMAKFVPHHTLTDLVPAGSITLDIRDFDTNRVLQRVTALFTAAEGTAQPVTRRSFTAFMSTGVDVVAWSRSPVTAYRPVAVS
ncbi:MAG: hypothetical protein KME47_17025 [Nodosilinea sp. WJT8-NPBG4]|jgi:hypothetical protein|nr:hypothetical protein [Nodosilinea sp. WJT8-NPBG4]